MGDAGVGGRLSRSRWRTRTMVHPIPSHHRSVWRGDDRLMGPRPSATSKRTDHCRRPNRHRVTPFSRHRAVRSGRSRNLCAPGEGVSIVGRRAIGPGCRGRGSVCHTGNSNTERATGPMTPRPNRRARSPDQDQRPWPSTQVRKVRLRDHCVTTGDRFHGQGNHGGCADALRGFVAS